MATENQIETYMRDLINLYSTDNFFDRGARLFCNQVFNEFKWKNPPLVKVENRHDTVSFSPIPINQEAHNNNTVE
jgi:hypothetical protein